MDTSAPSYHGEGPFALWHFSEDPTLGRFTPRIPPTNPTVAPMVWAIDTRHSPTYWFPRNCPRACVWEHAGTTEPDREAFFSQSAAVRIHVIESEWLDRMRNCQLYAYRLPSDTFRPDSVNGYWVSDDVVHAEERVVIDDLIGRHADAGIELRVTPSMWPFWDHVSTSTLGFSGCRLNFADAPRDRYEPF
jgi:hypothetical protein